MVLSEDLETKNLLPCPACWSRSLLLSCLLPIFVLPIHFRRQLGGAALFRYVWFCWRRYVIRGDGGIRVSKAQPSLSIALCLTVNQKNKLSVPPYLLAIMILARKTMDLLSETVSNPLIK